MAAKGRHMEGLGNAQDMVKLVPNIDLSKLSLSVQEGFVLSRIDGTTNIETLCLVSGFSEETTLDLLRRLRSQGVLVVGDEKPIKPSEKSKADFLESASRDVELRREIEQDEKGIELAPERRLKILSFYKKLGELSFFELLGVDPDGDAKAIRRAYFVRSKEFHPDRYYMKKMGRYAGMLDEIFKQVNAANKFLEDEQKRREYRETIRRQVDQETMARQVDAQMEEFLKEDESAKAAEKSPSGEYRYINARKNRQSEKVGSVKDEVSQRKPGARKSDEYEKTKEATAVTEDPAEARRREEDRRRRRDSMALKKAAMERKTRAREFFDQGMAQMKEGKTLAAAASLKLALSFDPANEEYQRCYNEAVGQSLEVSAENYFKRGIFEESVGRYDAAKNHYAKAAELFPQENYFRKAAETLLKLGQLMEAKDYATKAVCADPQSFDARMVLVEVFLGANLKKNALREAEEAQKLEPENESVKELIKRIRRS